MQGRKMLSNVSYFAFTATPKNRTEELFGTRQPDGSFRPFHSYTMKQAIQEGFIKDVLANYTTVASYYKLLKTVEEDPEFDVKRAQKKLRRYVESHQDSLRDKAALMLEHFVAEVWRPRLVGGKARAMLVTDGVQRVLDYRAIFEQLLAEQELPFKVVVAFSGEREWGGRKVTEATLNGFPSQDIPDRFAQDPYRILIVADKFQTGFDEPLLQTMYVDKALSDVKAVQTLSRLNRAHPDKGEVFVMDFANEAQLIKASFEKYYKTTILSEGTDINKLHDLKRELDALQVYSEEKLEVVVQMFLEGDARASFEGILDGCAEIYVEDLDEDEQVSFKGSARAFVRLYSFLSALIEFNNPAWERLSIFLNFLIPKLPTPRGEDMSRGLLETIDLESYRNEVRARQHIKLEDEEGILHPIPSSAPKATTQTELDFLSNIVSLFNQVFGDNAFKDQGFVVEVLTEDIPKRMREDDRLNNAVRQGDRSKIELETRRVMREAMVDLMVRYADHTEDVGTLLRGFVDNDQQRRFLLETVQHYLKQPYQKEFINHPGWDELIELMDGEERVKLARGLQANGVPAPMDIDFEIPGTDNERAMMVWMFESARDPVGLVDYEVSAQAREMVLVQLGHDPDLAEFAPQLIALLEQEDPGRAKNLN